MTRDEVIQLAMQAGLLDKADCSDDYFIPGDAFIAEIEEFVSLIAAAERKWVGLTDEEFNDCLVGGDPCENLAEPEAWAVMKEVEAKLKEKNNG